MLSQCFIQAVLLFVEHREPHCQHQTGLANRQLNLSLGALGDLKLVEHGVKIGNADTVSIRLFLLLLLRQCELFEDLGPFLSLSHWAL